MENAVCQPNAILLSCNIVKSMTIIMQTFSVGRRQIIFMCVFIFLCVIAWYNGTKVEV